MSARYYRVVWYRRPGNATLMGAYAASERDAAIAAVDRLQADADRMPSQRDERFAVVEQDDLKGGLGFEVHRATPDPAPEAEPVPVALPRLGGGPFAHRWVARDGAWVCTVCTHKTDTEPPADSTGCPAGIDVQATIHAARRPATEGEERALREFWRGGGRSK